MKRLMSAALALALLSGTAASADPWHGPRGGHYDRYDRGYRHHHDDGAGTAIAVGVGLLALTAIIAASDHDRDRARPYYADVPPPPPPPPYRDGRDYRAYPQAEPDYDRYGPPNPAPYDDRDGRYDGRYDRD